MRPGAGPATTWSADAWAFLQRNPDYRVARAAASLAPRYEEAPFPIRIGSARDRAAAEPWRLLAWEDPDGPVSPFWDIPMLSCVLVAGEPPLVELAGAAGSSLSGLRIGEGVLVLKIERGDAAVQLCLTGAGRFPERGGIELRHGVLNLPQTMRRERDLWNLLGGPAPRPGRVRGAVGSGSL
ncbi:MAG: hypothetical protein OXH14_15265 [Alphaproteobacteria bacterium]|nr:hypothetical protein [Alphaproteobacteria bacterium]